MAEPTPAFSGDRPAFTVDLLSQMDIDYWCQILNVSPEQLREAVQHAGNDAADVARYLRGKG